MTKGTLINKQKINTDKKTNILTKFLITLYLVKFVSSIVTIHYYINEQNYKKNSIYERANDKK